MRALFDIPKREKRITKAVYNCEKCGLCNGKGVTSPKMVGFGACKKGIMIVLPSPDAYADKDGVVLSGERYNLVSKLTSLFGINLQNDCYVTTAMKCVPPYSASRYGKLYYHDVTDTQVKCCASRLEREVAQINPKLIICMGAIPFNVLARPDTSFAKWSSKKMHGLTYPVHKHSAWVGGMYSPEEMEKKPDEIGRASMFDLADVLAYLDAPLPEPLKPDLATNRPIATASEFEDLVDVLINDNKPVAFDYEATCISAFEEGAEMLSIGVSNDVSIGYSLHFNVKGLTVGDKERIHIAWRKFLCSGVPKVVQNTNMESSWSEQVFGVSVNNIIWDTMVSSHVVYCRSGTTGLAMQVYKMVGGAYKDMVDASNMKDADVTTTMIYNSLDARYTLMAYEYQKKRLGAPVDAFNSFFIEGTKALARMKNTGIPVSVDVLNQYLKESQDTIEATRESIQQSVLGQKYYKLHGNYLNNDSPKQLSELLFIICKEKPIKKTKTGFSTDEGTLKKIAENTRSDAVREFLECHTKMKKFRKFITQIEKYKTLVGVDGRFHPNFLLNVPESYRSSATEPNIQNVYKHDEELKVIRRAVVPSEGRILLEADYDALEMVVAAMVSGDACLTEQVVNEVDIHRYWASLLYNCKEEDVTKKQRQSAKNGFVFPSIYGSLPKSIAHNMKELNEHLIESVQEQFWNLYSSVKAWQLRILDEYNSRGYVESVTGFRRYAPLSTEQLYNTPIQGPAFHLMLSSIIKIYKRFDELGLKTDPIFEIHDGLTFDTVVEEREVVIEEASKIFLCKHFEWQGDVPLFITWEEGNNWYDMKEIEG